MEPNLRETHESHLTVCVELLGREDAFSQQMYLCSYRGTAGSQCVRKMLLVCWHSSD